MWSFLWSLSVEENRRLCFLQVKLKVLEVLTCWCSETTRPGGKTPTLTFQQRRI